MFPKSLNAEIGRKQLQLSLEEFQMLRSVL